MRREKLKAEMKELFYIEAPPCPSNCMNKKDNKVTFHGIEAEQVQKSTDSKHLNVPMMINISSRRKSKPVIPHKNLLEISEKSIKSFEFQISK